MKLRYLAVFLISLACLIILGRQFNWSDLLAAVREVGYWWIVPAVFMYLVSIALRTLRWRVMIETVHPIDLSHLFQYISIGFMTNNLLPARLGEVVRAYVTGKREGTSRSAMFASIVLERVFDGLTIVFLFVVMLFLTGMRHPLLMHLAWVSALVFVAAFTFLVLLTWRRELAFAIARRVSIVLPQPLREKVLHILVKFVRGLVLLHHPIAFVKTILLSFAVWGAELAVYAIFREAFPSVNVSFEVLIIALVFVNLSAMLPALPANALVFQVACSQALIIFGGVEQNAALLYSVILHATQIFPMIILGYVFMGMMGLKWSELKHAELEEEETGLGSNINTTRKNTTEIKAPEVVD